MSGETHARHAHGEAHPRTATRRALGIALALAAGYVVVEVVGAWWTGSLALLADAGHMLSDVAALALALFASWVASRPAGPLEPTTDRPAWPLLVGAPRPARGASPAVGGDFGR